MMSARLIISRFVQNQCRQCSSSPGYIAATLDKHGGPLRVHRIEKTLSPHDDEVLVNVDSAGLNYADVAMMEGRHRVRHTTTPFVPGFELAGEVTAVGKHVKTIYPGDRICALRTHGTGAFATQCLLHHTEVIKVNHTVQLTTAAALPVSYGTAMHALSVVARAREGQTVLVCTTQGGTGVAAVDIAQNVFKCKVIVVTSTDAKCEFARQMGIVGTVAYPTESMQKSVFGMTDGEGVDICIDTVGGSWFEPALECVKPGGHLVSTGFSSEVPPTVCLDRLVRDEITVTGVWLGGLCTRQPHAMDNMMETLLKWREERYIHPKIGLTFPLVDINEAIKLAKSDKPPLGKIIIECRDTEIDDESDGEEEKEKS